MWLADWTWLFHLSIPVRRVLRCSGNYWLFYTRSGVTQPPGICPLASRITDHSKQVVPLRAICSFVESVLINLRFVYCKFIVIFVWTACLGIALCLNIVCGLGFLIVSLKAVFNFDRFYWDIFPKGTNPSIIGEVIGLSYKLTECRWINPSGFLYSA